MGSAPSAQTRLDGGVAGASSPVDPLVRTEFNHLVQSPLRARLLRHLHQHAGQSFDLPTLVLALGSMPHDLEACLRSLLEADVARIVPGTPVRYAALSPPSAPQRLMLQEYLDAQGGALGPGGREEPRAVQRLRELVGTDEKMLLVLESIRTVAKTDISVLILGATGVGKEGAAQAIHALSRRRQGPFQAVNCAALPEPLFESEVFGYERGAFTGAYDRKPGRIELANRGTLFLDEIGDLALAAQAKLLRTFEERRVERLGSRAATDVDFRLLSATNRPVDALVAAGRFREDLYYRVNAFTIRIPALRERPGDIPILAARFLAAYCLAEHGSADARRFSAGALDRLAAHAWPGNIRELIATITRSALRAPGRVIDADDLEFFGGSQPVPQATPEVAICSLRDAEREHIAKALAAVGWNKKKASRVLKVSRETLYRKIRTYRLEAD
jgi:transcriptional regulator with PAS, ATPase and Fis domain